LTATRHKINKNKKLPFYHGVGWTHRKQSCGSIGHPHCSTTCSPRAVVSTDPQTVASLELSTDVFVVLTEVMQQPQQGTLCLIHIRLFDIRGCERRFLYKNAENVQIISVTNLVIHIDTRQLLGICAFDIEWVNFN